MVSWQKSNTFPLTYPEAEPASRGLFCVIRRGEVFVGGWELMAGSYGNSVPYRWGFGRDAVPSVLRATKQTRMFPSLQNYQEVFERYS